jgi:ribosomal protein S10
MDRSLEKKRGQLQSESSMENILHGRLLTVQNASLKQATAVIRYRVERGVE